MYNQLFKWIEFLILFILIPILVALSLIPAPPIVTLFCVLLYTLWIYRHSFKKVRWSDSHRRLRILAEERWFAWRFLLSILLLSTLTWYLYPEKLFSFIINKPHIYLLIAFFYPLFSVLPQEFLYRTFFFDRYKSLFKSERYLMWSSVVLFAFLHLIYMNLIAVVLSFAGGYLFAHTFRRTKSLLPVVIEHYLYGMLIFTIGLVDFFYINLARLNG